MAPLLHSNPGAVWHMRVLHRKMHCIQMFKEEKLRICIDAEVILDVAFDTGFPFYQALIERLSIGVPFCQGFHDLDKVVESVHLAP